MKTWLASWQENRCVHALSSPQIFLLKSELIPSKNLRTRKCMYTPLFLPTCQQCLHRCQTLDAINNYILMELKEVMLHVTNFVAIT